MTPNDMRTFDEVRSDIEIQAEDEVNNIFGSRPLDRGMRAEIRTSQLPPKGWYVTSPDESPVAVEQKVLNFVGNERPVVEMRATVTAQIGGQFHTVRRLRFELSPQAEFAREFEGGKPTGKVFDGADGGPKKFDLKSRLWVDAEEAYLRKFKEEASTVQQICNFLKDYPVALELYHGQKGEMAVSKLRAA